MCGECEKCGEHTLECRCEQTKLEASWVFLDFLVKAMNEFAPQQAKQISIKQSQDFIEEWIESRFHNE